MTDIDSLRMSTLRQQRAFRITYSAKDDLCGLRDRPRPFRTIRFLRPNILFYDGHSNRPVRTDLRAVSRDVKVQSQRT
jgi:hypothetical protein